jgi:hypothetical protein
MGLYYNDHLTPKDIPKLPSAPFLVMEILTPVTLAKANALYCKRAVAIGAYVSLGDKSSHLMTFRAITTAARLVHGQRACFSTAAELEAQRTADSLERRAWLYASNEGGSKDAVEAAYTAALALALGVSHAKLFKDRPEKLKANTPLPEHLSLLLVRASVLSLIQTVRAPVAHAAYAGPRTTLALRCMSLHACVTYLRCSYVRYSR